MKFSRRDLLLSSSVAAFGGARVSAQNLPRRPPEVAIATPDGRQLLLSQYRGKVVALEFLLTTCPSCQRTAQLMNRLSKEYATRGFQPLGAAFNPDAHVTLSGFLRQFQIEYPVGAVSRETTFAYLQRSLLVRTLVPILVFISRDGMIRAQYTGEDAFFSDEETNTRQIIERLLAESKSTRQQPSQRRRS